MSYRNNASPYQNYISSQDDFRQDDFCLDRSYSTSISDSSSQSKILKELEELKRRISELEQTKKTESQKKLPIPINFEQLENFMLNEFSFFVSKVMDTTSQWLSQFRSMLLSFII
jgi:pyridoxine/pyridoxamine 5'-phosphate oxidase